MHDLDRTILDEDEYGYEDELDYDDEYDDSYEDELDYDDEYDEDDEFDEFDDDEFDDDNEFDDEMWEEYEGYEDELDYSSSLDEEEELDLATELMDVSDGEEMEEFLGKFFRKIGRVGKRIIRNPIVKKQWRAHQKRKKRLLPIFQKMFGSYFGGGGGGGGFKFFEVGLEGLSPEEQRFEVAKKSTKFMNAAMKYMPKDPRIPTKVAVKKALRKAARRHMPQLLRSAKRKRRRQLKRWTKRGRAGRWMRSRNGKHIILLGV